MRDHAVGMRELPGREGVGGEALVHEGDGALEALVLQVEIIVAQLRDEHHALVDDGARGQADRIIAGRARVLHVVDGVGDDLAGEEEATLEVSWSSMPLPLPMKIWRCCGSVGLHALAEIAGITGTSRQPRTCRPSSAIALVDDLLDEPEALRIARHEQVADAVLAFLGQPDAELGAFGGEELMRDLDQDAAAVAHLGVGAHRAAMVEVVQDRRPCSTMACDLRFFMSAMKPTPQESCSFDGS